MNKLERISSIASVHNQADFVAKVKVLSQRAMETYIRDVKHSTWDNTEIEELMLAENEEQIGLFKSSNGLHVQELKKSQQRGWDVNQDMKQPKPGSINQDLKLMQTLSEEVKQKLIKISEQGHDINEILMNLLAKREEEIDGSIEEIGEEVQLEQEKKAIISMPTGRYVPAKIRKVVVEKYGHKCSEENCKNIANRLHHENEFAKWKTHDPRYLRPLCKEHHELRHART